MNSTGAAVAHKRDRPSPLEEARALRALVDHHGTQTEVARQLGYSQGWVAQRLALLDLIPELQTALDHGYIKVAEARRLGGLTEAQQWQEWEEIARRSGLTADAKIVLGPARPLQEMETVEAADVLLAQLRRHKTNEWIRELCEEILRQASFTVTRGSAQEIAEQLRAHLDEGTLASVVAELNSSHEF